MSQSHQTDTGFYVSASGMQTSGPSDIDMKDPTISSVVSNGGMARSSVPVSSDSGTLSHVPTPSDFREFLQKPPPFPDAVISYYMEQQGLQANDVVITRLISLTAEKFLFELTEKARKHAESRLSANAQQRAQSDGSDGPQLSLNMEGSASLSEPVTLTQTDLNAAMKELGIRHRLP